MVLKRIWKEKDNKCVVNISEKITVELNPLEFIFNLLNVRLELLKLWVVIET